MSAKYNSASLALSICLASLTTAMLLSKKRPTFFSFFIDVLSKEIGQPMFKKFDFFRNIGVCPWTEFVDIRLFLICPDIQSMIDHVDNYYSQLTEY